MAKGSQKTTSKQRNRIKVGKLEKSTVELTKAKQKKVKGGFADGSVRFIKGGTPNT